MTQSARDRDEPASANLPVQDPWFQVTQPAPDLFRITEPRCHRWVRANSFLILGQECDILVDSGMGVAALRPVLDRLSSRPKLVFTTHAHVDHVGSHPEFADCEILVHPAEADELARSGRQGLRFPTAARRKSPCFVAPESSLPNSWSRPFPSPATISWRIAARP